ncbi:MAG TPA: 30S ribosomal protein S14 [Alphaproteobacteria bacterium]|nr:30S ribosomal protein S14 [Alphaproteobacteria bacterium]
MAKRSVKFRQENREAMVKRHAAKRADLKAKIINENLPFAERMEARDTLNAMPRDGAKTRLRNRCQLTGRPRGVYSRFGLGRSMLRKLASTGMLPGVRKGSM